MVSILFSERTNDDAHIVKATKRLVCTNEIDLTVWFQYFHFDTVLRVTKITNDE